MELLLLIPIVGTITLAVIPMGTRENIIRGKRIALFTSVLTLIQSVIVYIKMEDGTSIFKSL